MPAIDEARSRFFEIGRKDQRKQRAKIQKPLILDLVVMVISSYFLTDLLGVGRVGFFGHSCVGGMVCDLSNLPFLPSLQWHFTFSHFVVEPGQEYEVTIHHLPKPIPDGDPNHQSRNFPVPGKSAIPSPSLHHMALQKKPTSGPDISHPAQPDNGCHCQHVAPTEQTDARDREPFCM